MLEFLFTVGEQLIRVIVGVLTVEKRLIAVFKHLIEKLVHSWLTNDKSL